MSSFDFDLTHEGEEYMRELKELESMVVKVGFNEDSGFYDFKERDMKHGLPVKPDEESAAYKEITIVQIAAMNELGTSKIPPRPFMKQSWENNQKVLKKLCGNAIKAVSRGGSVEKELNKLGSAGKAIIQKEIVDGKFVANAPYTIKVKKSDKPLIDTGQMRQSVHYVIQKAGGKK